MTKRFITLMAAAVVGSVTLFGSSVVDFPTKRISPQEVAAQQRHEWKAERTAAIASVPRLKAGELRSRSNPKVRPYSVRTETPTLTKQAYVTSEDAGYIYGGAIYADNWSSDYQPVGIYSFEKNDGSTVNEAVVGEDYIVTGGGVFANGKYHYVSYMQFMGIILAQLYTVDFETWNVERSINVEPGSVAQDMAYDPTTGNAYGCFMNDNADGWVFGYLNLETGERTMLCNLDLVILSVGVNSKGDVYGVGADGVFYKFDKHNGSRTTIGNTGRRPYYSASGCFDMQTDVFYWECIEMDNKARLYTIDTQTGAATYITDIAHNMEMTGMFIPVADAADDAPARVQNLTPNFSGTDLTGNVTFTMPTKNFAETKTLSGNLTYELMLNEKSYKTATAAAGANVSVPVTVSSVGTYRFAVVAINDVGRSPIVQAETWVGGDTPLAVDNLRLTRNAATDEMKVTWTAPVGSVHNGYINPSEITYDVVRYPDGVSVASGLKATTFTEKISSDNDFVLYEYEVTPSFNGSKGASSRTNQLGVGVCTVPYANNIDNATDFQAFSIEDTNKDGITWEYDAITSMARCKYSSANSYTEPMNDWLFTPSIKLKPGHLYRFSADLKSYDGYNERAEFGFGSEATSAAMTISMQPVTVNNAEPKNFETYVSVPAEGKYYFGIHGCSPADKLYLYADNIKVEDGPALGTPGRVTDLSILPGDKGELKATISFKAPTVDVQGDNLTSITSIDIYRDNNKIHSVSNPATGQSVTYVDSEARQSNNHYTIVCVNAKGEGYRVERDVYVGQDRPGLPLNVHAREENGKAVITWDAPDEGETGGYIDPASLTYTVLRANDEKELAVGLTELTFTDANPPIGDARQGFFQYYVYAKSPAGYGYGQASNSLAVGEPYTLPFNESFTDGSIISGPWDLPDSDGSDATWKVEGEGTAPACKSYDNDGGMVTFIPGDMNNSGKLVSSKISLAGVNAPVAEFRYYATSLDESTIHLEVSADDAEFQRVGTVNFADASSEGWVKARFSLDAFKQARNIQIAICPKSPESMANVHIDAITVKEDYEYNLTARTLTAPQRMMVGENAKITFTVENTGRKTAKDFTVELYRDDKLEQTLEGVTTLPDKSRDYIFEVSPRNIWNDVVNWTARVVWSSDLYEADNTTAVKESKITRPNYPAINDLSGELTDSHEVNLSWSEPTVGSAGGERTLDDVESYKAFSIDGFGDWTVRDDDKATTYGISGPSGAMQYENAGMPMSFMAFNPVVLGIPTIDGSGADTGWMPHSDEQVFASFGSTSGKNDDWLISPLLPGIAQEVSFWVKSVTDQYGFEKYEVYYSTTGIEKADFIRIGDMRSAPVQWVEEKVQLPEDTRYFAIRCVSEDAYIFMVDDISFYASASYTGELSLVGYNVYRNDECLTSEPIMEQEYTDTPAEGSKYRYAVTVVYDKGESAYSNVVNINLVGVEDINADGVNVVASKGKVTITGAEGRQIRIFTIDGKTVTSFTATDSDEVYLTPAVYIVQVDDKAVKLQVL